MLCLPTDLDFDIITAAQRCMRSMLVITNGDRRLDNVQVTVPFSLRAICKQP